MPVRRVHISFDDVFTSLRCLVENNPRSIFDMEFFSSLKHLHEEYNAAFSLYAFYGNDMFSIDMIPEKYCREFRQAADWMKFGFHALTHKQNALSIGAESFDVVLRQFITAISGRISAESLCNCLRLHNWAATAEQVMIMKSANIQMLLCRESLEPSYDLTQEESMILYDDHTFEKSGMQYCRTNVCYDNCPDINAKLTQLFECGKNQIVLFGHEKQCMRTLKSIGQSVRRLYRAGYTFFA